MDANKRKFLKMTGGVVAAIGLPAMGWYSSSLFAAAPIIPNRRKLVILHLDGGNDGVNTLIPIDPTQFGLYQSMRPDIYIPLANVLPVGFDASGIRFGLHPAMASLMPYQSNLALFPATHTGVNSNRSHFFQHDMLDAGLFTGGAPSLDQKGWLGRYLDNKYLSPPGGIIAQDFAGGDQFLLDGNTFVLKFRDPAQQDLGTGSTTISTAMWNDIKLVSSGTTDPHLRTYSSEQHHVFDEVLPRLTAVNFNRLPGATYPTGLGSDFKKAADMLIALPELEVIHLSQGGYDTHSTQGGVTGQQANILKTMADSMAAFYADLVNYDPALNSNVAVIVMSEFGRTVHQNQDKGTDHGQATSWMVFGGGIRGGVYGNYPGLELAKLEANDWLRTTIDYRDIFTELTGPRFLGATAAQANALFPGYAGATNPLNFT